MVGVFGDAYFVAGGEDEGSHCFCGEPWSAVDDVH
jgi:hypothetical protein